MKELKDWIEDFRDEYGRSPTAEEIENAQERAEAQWEME